MSVTSKIKKRTALLAEVARRFPLRGLIAHRQPTSTTVLWLHHRYPDSWLGFIGSGDSVLKDVALINALAEADIDFRVVSGNAIGSITNSTIVYSIDTFNPNRLLNYSASLMTTLRQLEAQGNTLYPSADEAELWENKGFMHRRFDELGINSPETLIISRHTDLGATLDGAGFEFPLLVKEPHSSNSQGVHKIASMAELQTLRRRLEHDGANELLVQRLLDMRRDLRVTMIGGEIVHHYWRINTSDEWMPTTTRKGSQVDFVSFPEQWRSTIVGAMDKLGLRNGAFDVCWDADDLDTEPYFLEVSPAYTPNPAPTAPFAERPYSDFKAQSFGRDSYTAAFAELVFDLHRRMVDAWGIASHRP